MIHRTRVGWRLSRSSNPFGSGSRNPSGPAAVMPHHKGRTHDRYRTRSVLLQKSLHPEGRPHTPYRADCQTIRYASDEISRLPIGAFGTARWIGRPPPNRPLGSSPRVSATPRGLTPASVSGFSSNRLGVATGGGSMIGDQRQCACGSGLRPARCCQMEAGALGRPRRPAAAALGRARGRIHAPGRGRRSRQVCLKALELAPGQLDACPCCTGSARPQGQQNAARRCCGASSIPTPTRCGRPTNSPCCCSARGRSRSRAPRPQRGPDRPRQSAVA